MKHRRRGRPKKHDPKVIFGFFSFPGFGENVISEYLQIRYNFSIIDLQELIRKTYIDYQQEPQPFTLAVELEFRKQFAADYWIKEAMKLIEKAGRPLAVVSHLRTYTELKFLQDQQFYGISLEREVEDRFLQQQLEEQKISKDLFLQNDTLLATYKGQEEKFSFEECLAKTDFTLVYESGLGELYKKIEKILSKTAKDDSVLVELLNREQK